MTMNTKIISALLVGCGFALSGWFIAHGLIDAHQASRFVQVKGLAERIVKADEAIWTINIKLVNNELPKLYLDIDSAQNKIKDFLLKQGFKETELTINSVSVMDNQSVSYNQNQGIPHYSADGGITVSSPDVDKIALALQKTGDLVQQGVVVTASNALYRFTHLNNIKPEMLEEATQSAHAAALSFSRDAKAALGKIRNAQQGLFTINDANSTYDRGDAIMKKIRVVTTVDYQLQ